ncbi:hypothetical protein [Verminephrobacter eiseniae]|uniref:Uncharacterized protein n=1 Tax=Verminephrobacter eiseniae (strain EF01-2) TaxID=391735 RepID=A1WKU7_VEREI|nr:hypothetical protein [Verminephrobacter eiseniae]ABM58254.1 hypothetical protein Veis_2509 [Verminephrobacter eiseniae EF01-2]
MAIVYASSLPFCPVKDCTPWFERLPISRAHRAHRARIVGGNAQRLPGM